jgi:KinB signaling pathway activation protein
LANLLTSAFLNWEGFEAITASWGEFIAGAIFLFAVGMTFSAVSQMSFFAYLLINRLALGLFRSKRLWHYTQLVLIAFTFFDLVYFRYTAFGQEGESWVNYLILPVLFLAVTVILAWLKVKQTNASAFVPALFLLFVVSAIAALPALVINDAVWMQLMLVTVLVCHAWQLFWLPRLNEGTNPRRAQEGKKRPA